jgi:hypothetical protein
MSEGALKRLHRLSHVAFTCSDGDGATSTNPRSIETTDVSTGDVELTPHAEPGIIFGQTSRTCVTVCMAACLSRWSTRNSAFATDLQKESWRPGVLLSRF